MIFIILLAGFILRIAISQFFTYTTDLNYWFVWSEKLVLGGFGNFYSNWSDYLPSYLYVLTGLGYIKIALGLADSSIFAIMLFKLPAIIADIACGFLIYLITKKWFDKKTASLLATIYIFNPAIIVNSALWGQVDGFLPFLFLLTIFLLFRSKTIVAGFVFGFLVLFKLQAIFWFIPLVIFLKRKTVIFSVATIFSASILFGPFINRPVLDFISQRLSTTVSQYPYASVGAFNFWAIFFLQSKSDQLRFLGLTIQTLGIILFAIVCIVIGLRYFQQRKILSGEKILVFSSALIAGSSFLFLTRAHERHFLPFIALITLLLPIFKKKGLVLYFLFSLGSVFNLFVSYAWMEWKILLVNNYLAVVFAAINIAGFIWFLSFKITKNEAPQANSHGLLRRRIKFK